MKLPFNTFLISCFFLSIACQSNTTTPAPEINTNQDSISNAVPSTKPVKQEIKKEAFELVPEGVYRSLNAQLAAATKKISTKEVIQMYYPAKIANKTSFETIDVQTKKTGEKTIVTLTHDNQSEHISIQGHRIVMTLEQKEAHWQIVSIQQQFKCWIRKEGAIWSNDKCS